jgi:thymidylate kinase
MILIIEGMDRCGKSTLVEQLRKRYFTDPRILVHHSSSPPKVENPNEWEVQHYRQMLDTSYMLNYADDFDIIFDRFHLGAIVYGKKYRNADPEDIYAIENMYIHPNDEIALVLLTDWTHNIMERDDNDSLESSPSEFDETRIAFEEAFKRSIIPNKLHINIHENGGFKNTYDTVTKFLDGVQNAKRR